MTLFFPYNHCILTDGILPQRNYKCEQKPILILSINIYQGDKNTLSTTSNDPFAATTSVNCYRLFFNKISAAGITHLTVLNTAPDPKDFHSDPDHD